MIFWTLIFLEAVSMKKMDISVKQLNFVLLTKLFKTITI